MESQYPLDYSRIQKGEVFSPDRVASIIGGRLIDGVAVSRPIHDDIGKRLAALKLKKLIETHRPELVCRTHWTGHGDSVIVLTDAEASRYTHEKFHGSIDRCTRTLGKQAQVDRSALPSEDARRSHDRRLEYNAGIAVSMLVSSRRSRSLEIARNIQARIGSIERETPGAFVVDQVTNRTNRRRRLIQPAE